MKVNYGLTIARCKIGKKVTKSDLISIRNRLFKDHYMNLTSFPVECFEFKKNQDLHYHACVQSMKWVIFSDIKYEGWSIKLKWLKLPYDIINWCGYVQKDKIDKVDLKTTIKQCQRFKKDKKRMATNIHAYDISRFLTNSESIESSSISSSPLGDE